MGKKIKKAKAPTEKWEEQKAKLAEKKPAVNEDSPPSPDAGGKAPDDALPVDKGIEYAADTGIKQPVEHWLAEKAVSRPIAAALMRYQRWGAGQKLTERQFDQALAEMLGKSAAEV